MGTGRWDKFYGMDSEIAHSAAHFVNPTHRLVIHRDLAISHAKALLLAAALSNDLAFRHTVPHFLRTWNGAGDKIGLSSLADLIEDEKLSGVSTWRFGVTPIPALMPTPGVAHFFEIRMIANLDVIHIPIETRSKLIAVMETELGKLPPGFHSALNDFVSKLDGGRSASAYPGAGAILKKVFAATPKKTKTKKRK